MDFSQLATAALHAYSPLFLFMFSFSSWCNRNQEAITTRDSVCHYLSKPCWSTQLFIALPYHNKAPSYDTRIDGTSTSTFSKRREAQFEKAGLIFMNSDPRANIKGTRVHSTTRRAELHHANRCSRSPSEPTGALKSIAFLYFYHSITWHLHDTAANPGIIDLCSN